MPKLAKPTHEKFAQRLAAGATQRDAFLAARGKDDRPTASRLAARQDIKDRVAELVALRDAKHAKIIGGAPAAPDRSGVRDPLEAAAWRAHDIAAAAGDQKGARQALGLIAQARIARPHKAAPDAETETDAAERAPRIVITAADFNAIYRQHAMTAEERAEEDAEDARDARMNAARAASVAFAVEQQRPFRGADAGKPTTAAERVALLESRRRSV